MAGKIRKISRGKFAGLTARTVAELMDCEESTAKRYLHTLAGQVGSLDALTLKLIGALIYHYREINVWKEIKREATRRNYGRSPSVDDRLREFVKADHSGRLHRSRGEG